MCGEAEVSGRQAGTPATILTTILVTIFRGVKISDSFEDERSRNRCLNFVPKIRAVFLSELPQNRKLCASVVRQKSSEAEFGVRQTSSESDFGVSVNIVAVKIRGVANIVAGKHRRSAKIVAGKSRRRAEIRRTILGPNSQNRRWYSCRSCF